MSRLVTLGAVLGLLAMVGCGGQESQEAAASSDPSSMAASEDEAMAADQQQMQLPEGVTMDMVNQGKQIFAGAGLCYTCHGPNAEGVPGLGANLTDSEWLHNDGSYDGIVGTIMKGVDTSESTSGTPMPPKGGSGITDEQVKAVAAYVWTLSHH